jgi:hypothetical protein
LELAAEPGQRLVVQVPLRNFWSDFKELAEGQRSFAEATYRPITPAIIKSIIVSALAAGWQPHEKQKTITLSWTNSGLSARPDEE